MIGRRELIASGLVALTIFGSASANACSLVPQPRPRSFSSGECQRELKRFVDLLNTGPSMDASVLTRIVEDWGVSIGDDLGYEGLGDASRNVTERSPAFFKSYRASSGKLDPRPVRLSEVNLIRSLKNRATYQFTLQRYTYHPADEDGCNGMFPPRAEFYGNESTSCLATFHNNRLQSVETFPEWYLEGTA